MAKYASRIMSPVKHATSSKPFAELTLPTVLAIQPTGQNRSRRNLSSNPSIGMIYTIAARKDPSYPKSDMPPMLVASTITMPARRSEANTPKIWRTNTIENSKTSRSTSIMLMIGLLHTGIGTKRVNGMPRIAFSWALCSRLVHGSSCLLCDGMYSLA